MQVACVSWCLRMLAQCSRQHVTCQDLAPTSPRQLPFRSAGAFCLTQFALLTPSIAPSSFSITSPHQPPSPAHCLVAREERHATPDVPLSETPDRCRQGLTGELSLLGPVSSSLDLTSHPSPPSEAHYHIHPLTLPDSPAPSQHHHLRLPTLSRHPLSDVCTLCTPQNSVHVPGDLSSTHLYRAVAVPSNPPSQHAFFHGPRCT